MSETGEDPRDPAEKSCPTCQATVEGWARVCPRCQYEWAVAPQETVDLHLVEFKTLLRMMTPRLWATPLLIGLNVLMFLLMVASGVHVLSPTSESLVRWGADFGPLTTSGQWLRLLTSTFLHVGIIHLLFNMYVLWDIGSFVERVVGNAEFLILYLIAGLSGSLLSTAWHPLLVSVGASGAVFGLFGVLLAFLLRHRNSVPKDVLGKLRNSTLAFLGYNLLFGLIPGIDMAAHLGGLIAGFACGWFAVQPLTLEGVKNRPRSISWVLGVASGAILVAVPLLPRSGGTIRGAGIQSEDLRAELIHFEQVERRSVAEFGEGFRRFQEGKLPDSEFAKLLESRVLPEWGQCRRRLAAIQGLGSSDAALAADLGRYLELREREWGLILGSIQSQDGGKANQAMRVHAQAEQAVKDFAKSWGAH